MTTARTVLILGARGRFGSAATRAFADAGWTVLAQHRPGTSPLDITGAEWLPCDVEDVSGLTATARTPGVVVHALNPAYLNKAWREQQPVLMQAAIEVARSTGATLMLPGNIYNFGDKMPSVLHEDTPTLATHEKGRIRIEIERQLLAAARSGEFRAVVIRAGDFFGGGTGSWFDQALVRNLHKGVVGLPGPLDVSTPWAYLPDLANTFVQVAEHRAGLDAFAQLQFRGHQLTGQNWIDALNRLVNQLDGKILVARPVPWRLIRLLGFVMPSLKAVADMRYLFRTPHSLDNSRLTALLGKEPHTDFDTAVLQALGQLKSTGLSSFVTKGN